jgi:hypothetical protein
MFLESFGKLCFSQIRPLFFYSFLLIPFLFSGSYLLRRHSFQQQLEIRFRDAAKKGKLAIARKMRKDNFLKRYSNADPFFLDKHIESLSFLQDERAAISSMIQHPALSNKRKLQERLDFLESGRNRLAFTEENIRTSFKIKETDEKQRHPVQMSENDLHKLLASIEDVAVGDNEPIAKMPQLLIRDLLITKIENPGACEVVEVEMELLKREWTN